MRRRNADGDPYPECVMGVEIKINRAEMNFLLYNPAGPVVRMVARVGLEVVAEAKRRVPVDKGLLRASIMGRVSITRKAVTATVGSPLEYALYVHQGTGLYGPKGYYIRPRKKGGVLRFKPKGASAFVFAKFVRGQRPQRFLVEALEAVSPWPVKVKKR